MKLLILGGTVFLGRHLAEVALSRGYDLTLFHRGQHGADLFPEVEHILGDRDGELEKLKGRRWDAVIDTSGYFPRVVKASARLLADAVEHYTFFSSISAYAEPVAAGADESAPLATMEDETIEEITGASYGPLKVLCETAVEEAMPNRALIIRPGLIVGPHDPSDRFTYWPARVARGGEVLAPSSPDCPAQIIDARDLAEWTLDLVEKRVSGAFNGIGPDYCLTMGKVLETSRAVSGSDATFTWADEEWLLAQEVAPWMDLPLWVPLEEAAFNSMSCRIAQEHGLRFRPLEETVRDTLEWDSRRSHEDPPRAGLTLEREQSLLEAWHKRA